MEYDDFNDFNFGHAVSDSEPMEETGNAHSDYFREPGMDVTSLLAIDTRQMANEFESDEAILS